MSWSQDLSALSLKDFDCFQLGHFHNQVATQQIDQIDIFT
jgi:hypothetical protein